MEEDKSTGNIKEEKTIGQKSLEAITACSIDSAFYKEKIKDYIDVNVLNSSVRSFS